MHSDGFWRAGCTDLSVDNNTCGPGTTFPSLLSVVAPST